MQSCSIHHCVLFFLTLTFTTAPVSAAVCSTTVKGRLHQSVILPCENKCSGSVKWALFNNRDVVFARCDQTSCSSVKEGYEMSHDQYLKGDLSLTITAADYSKRNTYVCECGINDISTVCLSIEIQMKPGEDLILDLSVPNGTVEVIYKSRDSADGEQICTVTQRSLQCKAEYTHRTSLSYPELTLRDVGWSDSGSYTIRDTENKKEIRVYAVSVTGLTKGAIAAIVLAVLLLVGLLIAGVIIYRRRAEQERRELKSRMKEVDKLVNQVQPKKPGQEEQKFTRTDPEYKALEKELKDVVDKVEKAIDDLEQQYRENRKHSEYVRLFCNKKRTELTLWKMICATKLQESLKSETKKVTVLMEEVVKSLEYLKRATYKKNRSTVLLDSTCDHVESHLQQINTWCSEQREGLNKLKLDDLEKLLDKYEQWCEEKKNELKKYRKKLNSAGKNQENLIAGKIEEESTPLNSAVTT